MPQDQDRQITLEEFEEQRRKYYGIPSGLTASLRTQESGGRQYDQSGRVLTSPKQAKGRYQVLKSTAAKYNLDPDDPFENVEASFRYLSELQKQVDAKVSDPGERWAQTLAGYHAGETRLREVNKTGSLPSTSDGKIRTDEYVSEIMNRWQRHDQGRSGQQQTPAPQSKPAYPTAATGDLVPPKPARPLTRREKQLATDEGARRQATPVIARMVQDFEALKREGSLDAARSVAAKIKSQFGQWMEVGEGDGWPYVKSKVAGWNPIQPPAGPSRPSIEDQQRAFALRPLLDQWAERAVDALTRGGGHVSKVARQTAGAVAGAFRAADLNPLTTFEPVDFPEWRKGEEERFRALEERRRARPSSFASDVGEGVIEAIPSAGAMILGTAATGGGLPAAMAIGGGMSAAGADWRDPARALTQTGLGAVAPVVGGKAGAAVGRTVASRLAGPTAQASARAGGELVGGGAGNVLASGAEQLAFEGRLDPRELAKQAVVGSALNVPGAVSATRRPLPTGSAPGVDPTIIESASSAPGRAPVTVTREGRQSTFGGGDVPPRASAADIGIRRAIDRYTQRADEINRSNIDPGEKAAQLAQARAEFVVARQAAPTPAEAHSIEPQAPSVSPDAAATPTLPPGVRIIRQGEQIPPRERGQRQIPLEIDKGDGTVETVLVLAPERIDGRRVNETMLRPMVESAIRNPQSAAQAPLQPEPAVAIPEQPPLARRQPPAIPFTQLGPEGLRTARAPEEALLPRSRSRATNTLQRDPGGAILAPESPIANRKLLPPGRPEDVPTEQLDAPPTRPLPTPDAPVTQESPALSRWLQAEDAPTSELPIPVGPRSPSALPLSAEAPQPTPVITQEPTNRITTGEGAELPRRVSRPLEGQPIEPPAPRRSRTERLPVPKATDENIGQLRTRQEELGRLAYDRRDNFTGDLRDEYNQINSTIRIYENEQAKVARGGHLEDSPPPGLRPERMTPPTGEIPARRRALDPRKRFSSREDERRGRFDTLTDDELVAEIRRLEDTRNAGIRGKSRLSPEQLRANDDDLKLAIEMQKESGRVQRGQGREPGERITPRTPGRSFKEAEAAREGRRIQHSQFGEVTEVPDQSGVGKGRLRVIDQAGNPHIIRNPRIAGNREAAFVKPSTVAIPSGALPELRDPNAPPSPLAGRPVPARPGQRISYAIPDEAMPELRDRPKPKFVLDAERRLKDAASGKLAGSGGRQLVDIAVVTGYKVYKSGMDFAAWSAAVVKQAGEQVRPHLRAAWDRIQSDLQGTGRAGQPVAKPSKVGNDLTFRERLGRKIGTAQTMAQLLNPKTIAQNIIGNAAFSGAKNSATFAAIPVDKFLSFVTKQRQVATPEMRTQVTDFMDGFADMYHAVRSNDYAALADNRYELNNERVFKGKVGGFFEDALNIALRAPDRGAYLAAYNDSVQQILAAHAKSKTKFSLDKIHEQAKMEAQQAVFQDSNIISDFTVGLRNLLNKVTPFGEKANFGLGDLVGLKYARTPANLVARGIEYSPLNFVNSVYKMGKVLAGKGNTFDQRAAALAFGKAFVGSAFGSGMGALLYEMGIITQPEQENRGVQAAERAEGLMGYQLNLSALKRYASGGLLAGDFGAGKKQAGDMMMSYDWLQPWAFSIGMGAAAMKAARNRKADAGTLEDTLTQIDAVTSTLTDQSILRNIRDVGRYGVKSTLRKVATDAPASFVPAVLNQARQVIDDRAREISKEKGGKGAAREALQKVLNRLPGASKRLPERKDIVGRSVPSRLPGAVGAALATVPGRFGKYNPHPVLSAMQEAGSGTTGISRKPDESEGQFRARRARAAEWLNQYGLKLTTSKAYQSASKEERKAALDYLKEQISKQSGEKHPSLYLFASGHVIEAARETERKNRRKAQAAASALQ